MNKFNRLEKIVGEENINKLNNINVLLVGIGGVGGIALEMLARSGIGNISVIDFDMFEESNLNRQILSQTNNVGLYKVDVAKDRVLSINPGCKINIFNEKLDESFINKLDDYYDYIIDACDDINAKVLLVKYALKNKSKIISSCGTGNRMHPEQLQITNIWKTEYDPLAKKLRHELRNEHINYKLPVVCSSEKPILKSNGAVGSCALVPNAAGIMLASYVINDIIENKNSIFLPCNKIN